MFLLSRSDLCQQFNSFMLSDFDELVHIPAIDDVDCGPYDGGDRKKKPKMTAAISKKLTKLQDDASRTAGLESKLSLANGCRVMVRRNVDLSVGLTKILSCSAVARRTCGMRLTLSCSTLTNVSAICSEKPFRLSAPVLTQRNDALHVAALMITERSSHASFTRCALSK